MLRFAANRLALAFMLALGLTTVPGYAQEFRYRYVSLDQLTLPTGYNAFNPTGIRNGGRVYGTLCDATWHCNSLGVFR